MTRSPLCIRERSAPASAALRSAGRAPLAIERIHDALAEIRAVARQDPAAAAGGAVLFLEKLSPALNQVDSSTGALGNATYDGRRWTAEVKVPR
jgi:hypothetical protein